ncbi:cytochrome c oxidase subunit II [Sphingomonas abietis]|uniref:Cytochrome c oxidase subunit 2 n=1 Tax=Sphingomonas abietis TaxID=3012344 RepID=A0ABY7NP17_9SPHN|nr:cytochrome c oxidase subunit II [Sphingomonas abietis]WBO22952.1 cytochrome c oxidase subunit II [Sphingomonas abietis]
MKRHLSWAIAAGMAVMAASSAVFAQASPVAPIAISSASPPASAVAAAPAARIPSFYGPTPGVGQPTDRLSLQPQVTDNGLFAQRFDTVLVYVITIICLFVLALIGWVALRYNRRVHPIPSRTSHNMVIEVIWTVAPVLILLSIAVPSITLLARQYATPKPDLTVKVIGHQWYWSYQYPDNGDFEVVSNILTDAQDKATGQPRQLGVDARMVVPVHAVIKIIATSDDVIHSFAVPAFWTKMDAVPGRLNETWFKVNRPGLYYGQCSELCGARHGYMPIAVEVVSKAQFAQWVAANGGTVRGDRRGSGLGGAKPVSGDATAHGPVSHAMAGPPETATETKTAPATSASPAATTN